VYRLVNIQLNFYKNTRENVQVIIKRQPIYIQRICQVSAVNVVAIFNGIVWSAAFFTKTIKNQLRAWVYQHVRIMWKTCFG
jgi:hypothetical protein